jgi:serine/threonine protein kinase
VKALRAISHASVVRVLETGEHHEVTVRAVGAAWVAFEFVEGRNLVQIMKNAPADPASILAMCKALCEALNEVHRQRIVHRDIKPENIILRGKRWAEPVLVDFGFAREVVASRLTRTGVAVGTSAYIAPEVQRDPRAVSPYSDQWSFARVVAELLLWSKRADPDLEQGPRIAEPYRNPSTTGRTRRPYSSKH